MQSQLANDIMKLIDTNTNRVIDMIVTEYGSGNQPFTREDCDNLLNLPSKLAKTTKVPKRNKVDELEVKADKNPVAKVEKNQEVNHHTGNTSDEYCVARVWGSAKDGTAGLPTNQCKKKATSGCFCTMHFKKNAEQSPWHLGLITDDPPETDHKGKTIKWVGSVKIKKQKVLPKVVEEVVHEPEVVEVVVNEPEVVEEIINESEVVVEPEPEPEVESDVVAKREPEVAVEPEPEPEVESDVVAKQEPEVESDFVTNSDLKSEPDVEPGLIETEPELIETEPELLVNDTKTMNESVEELFNKIDTNGDGVIDKEELLVAVNNNVGVLFDPDADSDSDADTELESDSEEDESDEDDSDEGESDEDGLVTESKVIDGKDYEVDAENNVYEKDEDDDWVKVGVFIDGELVKND